MTVTRPSRGALEVIAARIVDAHDVHEVVELVADSAAVAIDAPDRPSTAPHGADATLSPKFRTARCGEIALGQDARIWVPWTTPIAGAPTPGWMQVGFDLWAALRAADHQPLEVYPAGVFRVLGGVGLPPPKTTRAGLLARIGLLAPHVALPDTVQMWTHDGIDALGAALVAMWSTEGRAQRVGHAGGDCDGSAIWLPAVPAL